MVILFGSACSSKSLIGVVFVTGAPNCPGFTGGRRERIVSTRLGGDSGRFMFAIVKDATRLSRRNLEVVPMKFSGKQEISCLVEW